MRFIEKHKWLFYTISFTWGALASIIGMFILLFALIVGKVKTYKGRLYGIFPKPFGSGCGFSIGCVFFISYDVYDVYIDKNNLIHIEAIRLMYHEMGHTLQNIIYGPLTLFIVTIPSIIRFWYRKSVKNVYKLNPYESIWFERQASGFGFKYID